MCGIWFHLGEECANSELWLSTLVPRGPEGTRILRIPERKATFGFTRLAIMGLTDAGMQPMERAEYAWICNGEIYNWKSLADQYGIKLKTGSDCEVIGPLFRKMKKMGLGPDAFFRALDGVFAIVILNKETGEVVIGRDPYGVRPLYKGTMKDGDSVVYASELKAMAPGLTTTVEPFEPGTYEVLHTGSYRFQRQTHARYHSIPMGLAIPMAQEDAMRTIRLALTRAVQKRMMTGRPVAALLSGGLDSSLIAALVQQELTLRSQPPLKTFSIGMAGSTDLVHARLVADHIGSDHTDIILTADEFFEAVPAVIHDIESFDTTTVRASVGNWLVAKAIRAHTDCKVVFNGDGSDEVWGSYLYFTKAPSDHAYEEEVTRLLREIHLYDVLRSDRTVSSHGLEPRTPFLDKAFVAAARAVDTAWRRPGVNGQCEKWLMREAFKGTGLLPDVVLWRTKEAFSDGVSSMEKSWYEICQEKAAARVPADWAVRAVRQYGAHLTPKTAEQYYYRSVFESFYGGGAIAAVNVPAFWMPRWIEGVADPSARTLGAIYSAAAAAAAPSSSEEAITS